MKQSLHVVALIDEEAFLEDMVEKLALRHTYSSPNKQSIADNIETVETSSTETYVSGTMAIKTLDEHIDLPFVTSFLFTCIKVSKDTYSLEWGISMS